MEDMLFEGNVGILITGAVRTRKVYSVKQVIKLNSRPDLYTICITSAVVMTLKRYRQLMMSSIL